MENETGALCANMNDKIIARFENWSNATDSDYEYIW